MTTSPNPQSEPMPEWRDPFAEPNTIPDGWDVSTLGVNDTGPHSTQEETQTSRPVSSHRHCLSLN